MISGWLSLGNVVSMFALVHNIGLYHLTSESILIHLLTDFLASSFPNTSMCIYMRALNVLRFCLMDLTMRGGRSLT